MKKEIRVEHRVFVALFMGLTGGLVTFILWSLHAKEWFDKAILLALLMFISLFIGGFIGYSATYKIHKILRKDI